MKFTFKVHYQFGNLDWIEIYTEGKVQNLPVWPRVVSSLEDENVGFVNQSRMDWEI